MKKIPIMTNAGDTYAIDENYIYAPMDENERAQETSGDVSAFASERPRESVGKNDAMTEDDDSDSVPNVVDASEFDFSERLVEKQEDAVSSTEDADDEITTSDPYDGWVKAEEHEALQARFERVMSDWENYRRRTSEEMQRQKEQANINMVEAMIPTLDNFSMAIKHADETDTASGMMSGFVAIYKGLLDSLSKEGLTIIRPAKGDAFDMNLHQAVSLVQEEGAAPDTVVSVIQDGYEFNGKVIRPASVAVVPN